MPGTVYVPGAVLVPKPLRESRNDGENDKQRTAEGTHTSPRPQGTVSSALARARQALMNEYHQSHDAARPSGRSKGGDDRRAAGGSVRAGGGRGGPESGAPEAPRDQERGGGQRHPAPPRPSDSPPLHHHKKFADGLGVSGR